MTVVVSLSRRAVSSSERPWRTSPSRSVLLRRQASISCSWAEAPWQKESARATAKKKPDRHSHRAPLQAWPKDKKGRQNELCSFLRGRKWVLAREKLMQWGCSQLCRQDAGRENFVSLDSGLLDSAGSSSWSYRHALRLCFMPGANHTGGLAGFSEGLVGGSWERPAILPILLRPYRSFLIAA